MKRRDFIATAGAATLGSALHTADAFAHSPKAQQILELRRYDMPLGDQQRLHTFVEEVLLPAYKRIGVGPVGAFTVLYGQTNPTLYLLLPYASLEAFGASRGRLFEDEAYTNAVDTAMDEAHYLRYSSDLMRAFEGIPTVEVPDTSKQRIFELRTYESHNMERAKRKVEMFNRGEIDIFRATNLTPVFFGETLIGERLPNLIYMVTHPDMTARDEHWQAFIDHPDWKAMSSDPYYAGTVSNISTIVLRPTQYSEI